MTGRIDVRAALMLLMLAVTMPAAGQSSQSPSPGLSPAPPGPFAIDLRGITVGIPQSSDVYPSVPAGTAVPKRGFGLDIGGHLYPARLGFARLGVGLSVVQARATAVTAVETTSSSSSSSSSSASATVFPDIVSRLRIITPHVSVNFGSSQGWSYLSAGAGVAWVSADASTTITETTTETGRMNVVHVGGGARWFITPHVGLNFDLRMYRMPIGTAGGFSAGLSIK